MNGTKELTMDEKKIDLHELYAKLDCDVLQWDIP